MKKRTSALLLASATLALLAGCNDKAVETNPAVEQQSTTNGTVTLKPAEQLTSIADTLLANMKQDSSYIRLLSGLPVMQWDDLSLEKVSKDAETAQNLLALLNTIPDSELSTDDLVFKGMIKHSLEDTIAAPEFYWLNFRVTPYSNNLGHALRILSAQPLTTAEQQQNYLNLVAGYAEDIAKVENYTRGQWEHGVLLPKPAIPNAVATITGIKNAAPASILAVDKRLGDTNSDEFKAQLNQIINKQVMPAFDSLLALFGDEYVAAAPQKVGLGQYPNGKAYYLQLIKSHTGLALTPEQIHEMGLKAIADLNARKQAIRDELGYKGTREEFNAELRIDKRFLAESPEEVAETFMGYIAEIEPVIGDYFSVLPKAKYGVKRLDLKDEPGQTYGYYQQPSPSEPLGLYRFNGSQLDKRNMAFAQHLIYHELLPGHHFHLALQTENKDIHPLRAFLMYGAFTEGWAEYAASLGEEMGLYKPYSMYGHLTGQSFLASRLVVDTGMNYLGWTREQAMQFMKENTFESDVQIATETLRYSTDMPGQALGYRIGFEKIWELRHRAEAKLGDRFDIKAFHAAVVGNGGMPLNVLEQKIDRFIAEYQ